MASIFNLQILNDNKYDFETSNVLKNKGTPNQKRQLTEVKELLRFLKRVQTIFGHCKYVRNHIRLYCNNPRYKSSFLKFKNVVIMLMFADLKFNKELNLAKNLKIFDALFKDLESSTEKNKKSSSKKGRKSKNIVDNIDSMDEVFDELDAYFEALKTTKYTNAQWRELQINNVFDRPFLRKLNKCVKNIQKCYQMTHEKLLEHDYTEDKKIQELKKEISNTTRQKEAILYYGFALNLRYIKEYNYCIRNNLLKKLRQIFPDIFNKSK